MFELAAILHEICDYKKKTFTIEWPHLVSWSFLASL